MFTFTETDGVQVALSLLVFFPWVGESCFFFPFFFSFPESSLQSHLSASAAVAQAAEERRCDPPQ